MRSLGLILLSLILLAADPVAAAGPLPAHDLKLSLDPRSGRLSAVDDVRVSGEGRMPFGLAPGFELARLTVDGAPRPTNGGAVDLGAAGEHRLVFEYTGAFAPLPDGRRTAADRPVAGSEGAYLPAGSGWLPRLPWDAFTYRVSVRVPRPWKAVTVGRLMQESETGNDYLAVFESETPQDAIPLMAGPWQVAERDHDGILLRTYFDAANAAEADDYLERTAGYIDLYHEWIGDYPFSAFHIVSAPLPVGYGFPGLTYIGSRVLALPFIRMTSLGHEILHNWWGNGVYVDYASGNWCEGLTTFMADYTYALRRGEDEAKDKRLEWLRDYAALPKDRDHPVRAFSSKTHDAAQVIGYNKVAFLFHMLREEIGQEAFDTAIRRFWSDNRFRVAAWEDLKAAFEAAAERDLGTFFRQWLERTGAPRLELADAHREKDGVAFTLRQDVPAYALSVPVEITTRSGSRREMVRLEAEKHTFTLDASEPVLSLSIDPDADLFRRLLPGEAPPTLRDVTLDPTTAVVAETEAARRLAERMMDLQPAFAASPASGPVLVIGLAGAASRAGLPPPPDAVAGKGTARIWAGRRDGKSYVAVEADDEPALLALLRPLPHYGRRGYLVFEGAKAMVKGNWAKEIGPLIRRFD